MKNKLFLLLALALPTALQAQNVQLHYDLGASIYENLDSRPRTTATIEMFKADKWGSTFLFTDIDNYADGTAGAYWEISREMNIGSKGWAAHVEYNGGQTSIKHTSIASRFQHALLIGGAWNWNSEDFSKTFSVQALYKQHFKGMNRNGFAGFQTTIVWSDTFANNLCTFSGYADLWHDPDVDGKLIFLSEPQFWVNLQALKGMEGINLSLGTEVRISNNFVYNDWGQCNRFYAIPTLAVKWTF